MENAGQGSERGAKKACIACGELIPVNATVCSHCLQRQTPEKGSPVKIILSWVGGVTAVLGLIGTLSGWFHTFDSHRTQQSQLKAQMAIAETQTKQGEYEASVKSYTGVLKADPLYGPAMEGQLDAAMLWVENFQVLGKDDDKASEAAGPMLDEIMPILDAGLARSTGPRAADVQAHVGWAHWLNWHIAEREFSHAAEQNLRDALNKDKNNVYANAMLGNWMLQNNEGLGEAVEHFNAAVATGKTRALVRQMQIGGLLGVDAAQARAELVKAVTDMRKNGEALDDEERYRVRSFCYSTLDMQQDNLIASLRAVPMDEGWKTYLWLDDNHQDQTDPLARDFVYANLLEVSGHRNEALEKFRALQQNPKSKQFSFIDRVNDAVKRLSKG